MLFLFVDVRILLDKKNKKGVKIMKEDRNYGHVNEQLHTTFSNSGRIAGMGISYDDYGDESGYRPSVRNRGRIYFPSDFLSDEEKQALNGEVKIIKCKTNKIEEIK